MGRAEPQTPARVKQIGAEKPQRNFCVTLLVIYELTFTHWKLKGQNQTTQCLVIRDGKGMNNNKESGQRSPWQQEGEKMWEKHRMRRCQQVPGPTCTPGGESTGVNIVIINVAAKQKQANGLRHRPAKRA